MSQRKACNHNRMQSKLLYFDTLSSSRKNIMLGKNIQYLVYIPSVSIYLYINKKQTCLITI